MKSLSSTASRRRARILKWGLAAIIFLVGLRIALPFVVLDVINGQLSRIPGYYGHVEDIDLHLYRGGYVVKGLMINRVDSISGNQTEILNAPLTDISIEWKSLFQGRIVTEIIMQDPTLRFTKDKAEPEQMEKDSQDFRVMLRTFTPLKVNMLEVHNGNLGFKDPNSRPAVDIQMTQLNAYARNLSNVRDTTSLPATVHAKGNVYGGTAELNMRVDALADDPTFDLNVAIEGAQLVQLNEFFQAYAKIDVNSGVFGMYLEIAAKDRKFIGYVKPLINDLDVVGKEDKGDNIFRKIWEGLVGVVGDILEAPKSDQIATKVPLAGEFGDRRVGVWYAIFTTLRNGLFAGLIPALDNQVDISTVAGMEGES